MSDVSSQNRKPVSSLTPVDRLFGYNYIRCQLAFHTNQPCRTIIQKGVERLLTKIPFLSQQLVIPYGCDNLERVKIQPSTSSNLDRILKIKEHGEPMQQALAEASKDKATFEDKFMPIGFIPDIRDPCPILAIQANLHPDGLLLSVAANHMVMDATGMGFAIVMLADCCRQVEEGRDTDMSSYAAQQDLGREMLLHHLPAKLGEREFPEYSVHKNILAKWMLAAQKVQSNSSSIRGRNFTIEAKDVNALKDRCNELLPHLLGDQGCGNGGKKPHDKPWVSSSDMITALIWLSLNRARYPGLAENNNPQSNSQTEEPTQVYAGIPLNIRHRVEPALPRSYLGNSVILTLVNQPLQTFASQDWMATLSRVAYSIRCQIRRIDNEYIRSLLYYIQNEPYPVVCSHDVADFYVSSWRDLGYHDADFGSAIGRPQQMRNPDSVVDGSVFIMPRRAQLDSPWEVQVSLTDEVLERFDRDSMWTKYMHLDSYWP